MSIDLSLHRINSLISCLPRPWYTRPTCHIAGTNGKGSVSALLASIFVSSGLSVGRFNSPHLISLYDCILINNNAITQEKFNEAKNIVDAANTESAADVSSFESLTMIALVAFEKAKVDIAVVEVGMGGRLDATNVMPDNCIVVSALTAVDLDHQAFLGHTVAEIAREKAGIARKATPFVLGQQRHKEVVDAVESCVPATNLIRAQVIQKSHIIPDTEGILLSSLQINKALSQHITVTLPCFPGEVLSASLPLYGAHQLENLGLAVSIISTLLADAENSELIPGLKGITPKSICAGIESTHWRGRLSFHTLTSSSSQSLTILADGAHNPSSSATLGNFIESLLHLRKLSLTYVLALSHSPPKSPLQTLAPLLSPKIMNHTGLQGSVRVALVRFTPPDGMPWVKSVPRLEMQDAVCHLGVSAADIWAANEDGPVVRQLPDALGWASSRRSEEAEDRGEELVVVAGSLYLVADLYRLPNLK
ncbi:hypothetical protein HWV62_33439 [Athelia sp. TMB]|nr:hypothetical protein HWV62_33439 [Athelia sp. TMB]